MALAAAVTLSGSSYAASSETDALVANVRLVDAFLRESSTLAMDRSESAAIRTIATDELRSNNAVDKLLDQSATLQADASLAMTGGDMLTGRSAAVGSGPVIAAPVGTGALMPATFVAIDRLSASRGGAFDHLYIGVQHAALEHLAAIYQGYAKMGDDPALRQIASQEATRTAESIAALDRLGGDRSLRD